MRIGFVGVGAMGTPMALRLLAAGNELSVWNRNEGRIKPLIHEGAIAAGTPAEAELGAEAVITMLRDDSAYEDVFFGVYRLIDALSPGTLHISCGTISVPLARRLAAEQTARGIDWIAARLVGSPIDAELGQVQLLAAGASKAMERARPLLETLSNNITVVGIDPWLAFAPDLKTHS